MDSHTFNSPDAGFISLFDELRHRGVPWDFHFHQLRSVWIPCHHRSSQTKCMERERLSAYGGIFLGLFLCLAGADAPAKQNEIQSREVMADA